MFEIGWHEFDISPKIGQPMGGYWRYNKFIKGIRDPVFGNVLILSNNTKKYVLVVLDELVLDHQLVQNMKEAIEKRTRIISDHIIIHVNHTHSTSITVPEPRDDDYPFLLPERWNINEIRELTKERRKKLVKLIASAAEIALENLTPARFGFRKGIAENIGRNRNQPLTGPVDNEVSVLRFELKNGSAPVLLTNFSTHPTIAPPDNCLVSGDLVGSTRKTIRSLMNPFTQILYTTGAAGDVSTRFSRKESSFAEVDRMGRILGSEVVKTAETIIEFEEDPELNLINETVEFTVRKLPDVETVTKILKTVEENLKQAKREKKEPGYIKKLTENLEGAGVQKRLASMGRKEQMAFSREKYLTSIQALRIGDVKMIFHPFELFSGIAINVKEKSGDPNVIIIGYSNNWLSYIPTQYAFDENSYETYITLAVSGTDKLFEDAFLNILKKIDRLK